MKYEQILALKSDAPFDAESWVEIIDFFSKRPNIDVSIVEIETYALQKAHELIVEKGASRVLSMQNLQEALLPKTDQSHKHLLVEVITNQLRALSPSSDLIVVDPYLFPSNPNDTTDFLKTVEDIFAPIIGGISKIRFVTKTNYNRPLYGSVQELLVGLKPELTVEHKTTEDFHDRFWIVDESRGLFIGTSLNGIGKRYALTDYMKDDDAKAVVSELQKLHLI